MHKTTILTHLIITIISIAVAIVNPEIAGKILFIICAIFFGGLTIFEIIDYIR